MKAYVDQAVSEIAEQLATNVLIIEDEPMIAIDLADLLTSLGHRVCETARTHQRPWQPSASTSPAWFWPIFSSPMEALGSTRSTRS